MVQRAGLYPYAIPMGDLRRGQDKAWRELYA